MTTACVTLFKNIISKQTVEKKHTLCDEKKNKHIFRNQYKGNVITIASFNYA